MTSLKALRKELGSGDLARARAAADDAADVDLDELLVRGDDGLAWMPAWRVKRDHVPVALLGIAHIVASHWDGERDVLGLVPPALWSSGLRTALIDRGKADAVELPGDALVGLVRVDGGTFDMGRHAGEIETGYQAPAQLREVAITRDVFVGATMVTRAQVAALRGQDAPRDPDAPAAVRHREALELCNVLSELAGLEPVYELSAKGFSFAGFDASGYRLLSEAEWEYCARAGTKTATYHGNLKSQGAKDAKLGLIAWYRGNAKGVQPVATRVANAFGLWDMLGNLDEWCMDAFVDLDDQNVVDPLVIEPIGERVVRGGGWHCNATGCRASIRRGDQWLEGKVGFRVARTASESKPERIAFVGTGPLEPEYEHVALDLPQSHARCLDFHGELVFIGTAGGMNKQAEHELVVFDRDKGEPRHRHRMPFLVSDVAYHHDVYLALGPGHLYVSANGGADTPVEHGRFTNAPKFARHAESLLVGTTYEGVWVDDQHIPGVRKTLIRAALDDTRVFAAYDDDVVRIFERSTGKRLQKTLKQARGVCTDGERLVTSGPRVALWDSETLEELGEIEHPTTGRGVGARICGDLLVTRSQDAVQVQSFDGELKLRWEPPGGADPYIWDALVADRLWIALGDKGRNRGRVLAVPLR